ncbi:hypothetical protein LV78_004673 [Actinosynnema pretiosum]|nr:hypothetical protein [Actinosynnema pretiosum]
MARLLVTVNSHGRALAFTSVRSASLRHAARNVADVRSSATDQDPVNRYA